MYFQKGKGKHTNWDVEDAKTMHSRFEEKLRRSMSPKRKRGSEGARTRQPGSRLSESLGNFRRSGGGGGEGGEGEEVADARMPRHNMSAEALSASTGGLDARLSGSAKRQRSLSRRLSGGSPRRYSDRYVSKCSCIALGVRVVCPCSFVFVLCAFCVVGWSRAVPYFR